MPGDAAEEQAGAEIRFRAQAARQAEAGDVEAAIRSYRQALVLRAVPLSEYKPFRKLLNRATPEATGKLIYWMAVAHGRAAAEPGGYRGAAIGTGAAPPTVAEPAVPSRPPGPAGSILTAMAVPILGAAAFGVVLTLGLWLSAALLFGSSGAAAVLALPAAALVALAISEVVLRLIYHARSGFAGWSGGMLSDVEIHIEDLNAIRTADANVPAFAQGRYLMHPFVGYVRPPTSPGVNAQGMVSVDYPVPGPSNVCRVLLLGGSVAERFAFAGTAAGENYITHHLKVSGAFSDYDDVKVYIGAVAGWNSVSFSQFARIYGERFDCVVVLFGVNEYYHAIVEGESQFATGATNFYSRFADLHVRGIDRETTALRVLIRQVIHLCDRCAKWPRGFGTAIGLHVVTRILGRLQDRYYRVEEAESRAGEGDAYRVLLKTMLFKGEGLRRSLRETVQSLSILKTFCERAGVELYCFLQPTAANAKELTMTEAAGAAGKLHRYGRYSAFCDEVLRSAPDGVGIFDLREVFAGRPETIYADFCHFVEDAGQSLGMDLVARAIAERVAEQRRGVSMTRAASA